MRTVVIYSSIHFIITYTYNGKFDNRNDALNFSSEETIIYMYYRSNAKKEWRSLQCKAVDEMNAGSKPEVGDV